MIPGVHPAAPMVLLAVAIAIAALLVVWALRRTAPAPINEAAVAPSRPPTAEDKALARLINAIDADMRSIELGRWFVRALVARVEVAPSCSDAMTVDVGAIARAVPGANEIAQAEVRKHLRDVLALAAASCDPTRPGASVADALRRMDVSAFGARGTLRGMPGYATTSKVPLPTLP